MLRFKYSINSINFKILKRLENLREKHRIESVY